MSDETKLLDQRGAPIKAQLDDAEVAAPVELTQEGCDQQTPLERATRSCGACQACCVVLGVKPIEKQPYHRCEHQTAKGCGVYEARPLPCQTYRCAWLEGLGERRDRPDRLGIIVDRIAPAAELQERAAGGDAEARAKVEQAAKTVRAREVRRGGLGESRAKRLVEALHRAGMLVVLVPFAGRKLPVGKPLGVKP